MTFTSPPFFYFMWPCIVTNFFLIKPTDALNFPNLFYQETLNVSGSSSAHHQKFIHCTLGTGLCHAVFDDSFRAWIEWNSQSCLKSVIKPAWHVQWKTLDDGHRNCPKHDKTWQNKFGKLLHLLVLLKVNSRLSSQCLDVFCTNEFIITKYYKNYGFNSIYRMISSSQNTTILTLLAIRWR